MNLIFTDAGISAPSKRVYYQLAQGKPVVIQKNQIWEFVYLADGKAMRTPPDKTGIVELCKGPLLIEDLKDLPVDPPVVTANTITWTSYARFDGTQGYKTKKTDLLSGDKVFMKTSTIKIDDSACPYTAATQTYPGLPLQCFSLVAFGQTFHDGNTRAFGDALNVTLQNLTVQYRDDETAGRVYQWTARWQLTFAPDALRLELPLLGNVTQANSTRVEYDITSGLPGSAAIVTNTQILRTLTGERLTLLGNTSLGTRSTSSLTINLPTDALGRHDVTAWPTLQTETGNIAFKPATAAYTVMAAPQDNVTPAPSPPSIPTDASVTDSMSWWERVWDWVRKLFTYTGDAD